MNQIQILSGRLPHPPNTRFEKTFASTYGTQLIASLINASMYGISMTMAIQYLWRPSTGDSIQVKGMVALLIFSATLETVCASHQIFEYLILKFGEQDLLDAITAAALGKYLGIHLTAFVAQMFYSSRIWAVTSHLTTRYRLLTYPVIILSCIQVSSGIAQVVYMGKSKSFHDLALMSSVIFDVMIVQGVAAALCDIAITASFSFIFHTNRSGLNSRIHSLLNKFIVYAINRAAATSLCALLTIFMFHYLSGTYFYMIPLLVNTHLYVISVVSVLRARGSLQEVDHSFHLTSVVLPSFRGDETSIDIEEAHRESGLKSHEVFTTV
ncbi:hypothetical protein BDQ17DRAFT_1413889 [Cyathus striatus]|nr:hypothetical protein BDQ17DRAFT_1413889 [Cyathus striatus]